MYVDLEVTRSLVLWSPMVLADTRTVSGGTGSAEEASVAASRAALQVATAGKRVGQEAIQLHGGIGVTAEYSVGHRLSRLRALEALLGDARLHTARLAGRVASYGEVDPLPYLPLASCQGTSGPDVRLRRGGIVGPWHITHTGPRASSSWGRGCSPPAARAAPLPGAATPRR